MSLTLDYFMDENLKLYQDKEHFRFNTDTKLLAKFVHLKKQERILDIGTNNAALLVYFDQFNVKELVGVEILEQTSKVAQKNADMFIKHPVKIVNQPIQRYEDELFDVIVSSGTIKFSPFRKNGREFDFGTIGLSCESIIEELWALLYGASSESFK